MVHRYLLQPSSRLFDRLHAGWNNARTHSAVGFLLVVAFLGTLLMTELRRLDLLPASLGQLFGTSHFEAVTNAFTLLLIYEVLSLVFVLSTSVAHSLGKQLEVLALIYLRHTFDAIALFGEPITWDKASASMSAMLWYPGGALAVFVLIGVYYRVQRHTKITRDEALQSSFVAAKKLLALALLAGFAALAAVDLARLARQESSHFFAEFYTLLILGDVLLVLIALRYTARFSVLFRNSGFAVATVLIRLSLIAPPRINVLLGVGATAFALALTVAYNAFYREPDQSVEES